MTTNFTSTFGASPVSPSEVAYAEYSFSTNLVLYWPPFSAGQANVAARFINLTATTGSSYVSMPDATLVSVGFDTIIFNAGAQTFDVIDFDGGAIATIATGQTYYLMLNDNITQAGGWQTVQFGVGTSSADAASLAGAGLLAIANTLNVNTKATSVSGSYNITAADRGVLQVWEGGAGTITIPDASFVGNGFFFPLANNGSGGVTITDGGSFSSVYSQTQSAFIISTGTGWVEVGKGMETNFAVTILNLNVAGNSDVIETSAQAQNIIQQFTGVLTGNINVIVPDTVQLYYVFNNTSGAYTLTMKTALGSGIAVDQGSHTILYCDGTNVTSAFTSTFGGGITLAAGSAGSPNLNFVGSTNTGIYSPSANQFAITAGGKEVMNFISDASAVNWFEVGATATGVDLTITAKSSDTNRGITIAGKGTGSVNLAKAVITGGSVDNTAIGGSTPAPVTGTTITANVSFVGNLTGNVTGNLTGNVTGSVTGNASTAAALQNARTIGGVSFNGTANITVSTATAGFAVSGGDLALGVNSITLTGSIGSTGSRVTKGWFTDLQVTNAIAGSITGNSATVTTNANLTGDVTSIGNATIIKSSVALAGSPTTTTQTLGDNSTKIATTAYADRVGVSAGAVLQTLQAQKTDVFSTASTTYVDVTGLSQAVTPAATANKVLVRAVISMAHSAGAMTSSWQLLRGSTPIGIGTVSGSRSTAGNWQEGVSTSASGGRCVVLEWLDSPSTISSTTYKVQMLVSGGTGYVNRGQDDTNSAATFRTASALTIQEIKG